MTAKRASKRGRGRPKMAKGERMAAVVAVRMKPDEKRHMATVAKSEKKSLAEWARDALLAASGAS